MQGMRPAGVYTVHWDGRGDQGQALASGVYLYRLRTGKQVRDLEADADGITQRGAHILLNVSGYLQLINCHDFLR